MPSSTRIIAAAATIGLVTEAMRKMRVAPHRLVAVERRRADDIDVRLTAPAEQRDETGDVPALDMAGHHVVHALEPRLGQSSTAMLLFPPSCLMRS